MDTHWDLEEKYRTLVANLPDVLWTTDGEGNITFISPNVEKVYGYSPEEIYKQGERLWFGRIHPDDVGKVKKVYQRLFKKAAPFDMEYRIKRKDGKWIWLHDRSITTYEKDGVMYADGLFSDITERKYTEEAAKEAEQKWRSLAENAPNMIMIVNRDGLIQFVNRTPPGFTVEGAVGKNIYDYIDPEHHSIVREAIEQVFQTGEPVSYENIAPGPFGHDSWYETQVGAIKIGEQVVAATLFVTDITERKKAQDTLKESEQKWRSLAENAPDVILTVKPEGTILFLNRTVPPFTPEKAVGTSVYDYVPPEYQDTLKDALERVVRTGEPCSYELAGCGPDGRTSWYQSRLGPIKKGGQVVALTLIATDVTEQKKADEALRESEERHRKLFEETTDAIFIADAETGILTDCNRAASELVGREKSDLIGKHQRILHPPQEIKGGFSKTFKQHIAEKEGQILEAQIITKKGEIKNVEIRASRFELNGEKRIQGMFRDITERKKAEQALRESQRWQRAILDSIPDIAWLKDKKGKYIAANEALCKAFDIKLVDLVGKTDFDISPEDLAKRYRADDQEVMKSGQRKRIEELWGKKHGKGKRIWIETIKTPIYNDQGQVIGTSGIARDITERKKAEAQLRKCRKRVVRAEQLASLGTLGAILAHEITQPLTVITLSAENALAKLERTSCSETVAKKLRDVLTEVSKVSSVAQRFRAAARKCSSETIREVDLKVVAERVFRLFSATAHQANVTLGLRDFDKLPPIYANEDDLEQVFSLLIDNAIQAADDKKRSQLVISGALRDGQIELRFRDNCGGIAPEHLDKVFQPFFTTKPPSEGIGLGLCIAEQIVSRAGGEIRVESKLGECTTFYVTLPIKTDPESYPHMVMTTTKQRFFTDGESKNQ